MATKIKNKKKTSPRKTPADKKVTAPRKRGARPVATSDSVVGLSVEVHSFDSLPAPPLRHYQFTLEDIQADTSSSPSVLSSGNESLYAHTLSKHWSAEDPVAVLDFSGSSLGDIFCSLWRNILRIIDSLVEHALDTIQKIVGVATVLLTKLIGAVADVATGLLSSPGGLLILGVGGLLLLAASRKRDKQEQITEGPVVAALPSPTDDPSMYKFEE